MTVRPREQLRARAANEQRELGLEGVDVADGLAALELLDVVVADADPPHLALVDQLCHHAPGLLDRRPRRPVGPVELVEVDPLHAEPAQARLALAADRLRAQVVPDLALGQPVPDAAALREEVDVLAGTKRLHSLADNLFRVAEPVNGCRVDPVDASFDRVPDRGHRFVVVDRAPTEPPRPADRPRPEADVDS